MSPWKTNFCLPDAQSLPSGCIRFGQLICCCCCWTLLLSIYLGVTLQPYGLADPLAMNDAAPQPPAAPSQFAVTCPTVSYGKTRLGETRKLTDLPLNELLIELNSPSRVTPPNPKGATQVGIAVFIDEISEIIEGEGAYQMEGELKLLWCDPRLAYNSQDVGADPRKIFLGKIAEVELERIWSPDVSFVNKVEPRRIANQELIISPDGTIEYRESFSATLANNYNLRRFPFDAQTLMFELKSFVWTSKFLQFQIEQEPIDFSSEFSIPEWRIMGVQQTLDVKQGVSDRTSFSVLMTAIEVQRDPGFYLTKILIPLVMIVMISWAVFWMEGDGLADRMSVSFTAVLTVVAYQFIVSENLPKHVYNSFLDAIVLLSFGFLVLTVIENGVVNVLYLKEQGAIANSVDYSCRWAFPLMYCASIACLAFFYLK